MRHPMLSALIVAVLGAAGHAFAAAQLDPAPVVAAEHAFAADALAMGVEASFNKNATPDAIVISAGKAMKVGQVYDPKARPAPANPALAWWPTFAGIARSGDLGFTTGPIEVGGKRGGHYFTVWKKQADGSWKWIYDGGVGAVATDEPPASAPARYLPLSTARPRYPEGAMAAVKVEEAKLAARAKVDQKAAFLTVLADDGRLHVPQQPPAKYRAAFATVLATYPMTMDLAAPVGGDISKAGDLAYTYGEARWAPVGGPRTGWYVHVWQNRKEGWRLVYSQILPTRGTA
jgi:ketosteroid isomerase-like protein